MKKNTITIDLDRLEAILDVADGMKIMSWVKKAEVPERCTLTELLSISDHINIYGLFDDETIYKISGNHDVDQFKSQYLDKEETLEDGIYEVELSNSTQLVYVRNGKWSACKNSRVQWKATDLINPVKIANL